MDIVDYIARSVKARRKALGFTLRELSKRSGVSTSMISAIEWGQKSPSVGILSSIAAALDVPVSHLIERESAKATVVTRKADLKKVTDKHGVSREHLGAVVKGSPVEFIRYTLPARRVAGCFAPHRPGTIERVFLLSGRVKVTVGEERHELSAGDAIVYHADVNHGFTNLGSTVAVIHLIIEQGR